MMQERKLAPKERRLLLSLDALERAAAAQIVYSTGLKPECTRL